MLATVINVISVFGQGIVTLGSDTTFNGSFEHPTPYGTHYHNLRVQYLIRAQELTGLGLTTGDISTLAFNVHALNNCSPMPDYSIKMKQTNAEELTQVFGNEGYTTVFSSPSFTPVVGWNTHIFDDSLYWDGQSNLLIDACFGLIQGAFTQNASVYHTLTPDINTVAYYRSTHIIACGTTQEALLSKNRANMQLTGTLATCLPPLNLLANYITANSATFSWSPQGSETAWYIKYGNSGFDPNTSGTLIHGLPSTQYTLSDLDPATTYDIYVRALCSFQETSAWSLPEAFTTFCQSAILPFTESFNELLFPDCWYQTFEGSLPSERWIVNNSSLAGG